MLSQIDIAAAAENPARETNIFDFFGDDCLRSGLWATEPSLGWPEVIALLTKAKTQATTCVQVLKANGDKASITRAQFTYGLAQGEMDGLIAGLTTALVQGGDPSSLTIARTSLETGRKGPQGDLRRRGQDSDPEHEGCVGRDREGRGRTLVQGDFRRLGALWTRHVEEDKLEVETKKSQLEAANGPNSATSPRNSSRLSGTGRVALCAGGRRPAGIGQDGSLRLSCAHHRSRHAYRAHLVTSRRHEGAVRGHRERRSDGEDLVGRRSQASSHNLDSSRAPGRWGHLCRGHKSRRIDDRRRRLDGATGRRHFNLRF